MKTRFRKPLLFLVTGLLLPSCTWTLSRPNQQKSSFSSVSKAETSSAWSSSESSVSDSSSYPSSSNSSSSFSTSSSDRSFSSEISSESSSASSEGKVTAVPYTPVSNNVWPKGKKTYRVKPTQASGDSITVYDVRYSTKGYLAYPTTLTIKKTDYCLTYETVALYYMAFRTFPPNYLSNKKQVKSGTDLRYVSTYRKGSSHTYDYTVALGTFQNEINGTYYEFDIALSSYSGSNRGAGRLVVVKDGLASYQGDGPVCFFTKDHYADFCEFYNFAGGWSEEFAGVYNKSGSYSNSPEVDLVRPNPTTVVPTYLSLS